MAQRLEDQNKTMETQHVMFAAQQQKVDEYIQYLAC